MFFLRMLLKTGRIISAKSTNFGYYNIQNNAKCFEAKCLQKHAQKKLQNKFPQNCDFCFGTLPWLAQEHIHHFFHRINSFSSKIPFLARPMNSHCPLYFELNFQKTEVHASFFILTSTLWNLR